MSLTEGLIFGFAFGSCFGFALGVIVGTELERRRHRAEARRIERHVRNYLAELNTPSGAHPMFPLPQMDLDLKHGLEDSRR